MATAENEQQQQQQEEEEEVEEGQGGAVGLVEDEPSEDPRVIFFREISQASMNYSLEKWFKMMANDELYAVIKEFIYKDVELLVLNETPNEIVPMKEFPPNMRRKGMYFLKLKKEPLNRKGFQTDLISGDISSSPLEQLKTFVEEVMIPLTCNPANREIWPESVYEDVTRQVQDFKNEVSKTLGIMKGHTTLPMPIGIEKLDLMNTDLIVSPPKNDDEFGQLMYAIETGVVQWTTQIQVLVEKDYDPAVFQNEYREPLSEIRFWKQRYDNFRNIHRQLKHPRVEKMAKILETTQSCYLPAFKKMLRDVTAVEAEAQDITIHLTPLEKHFERIDQIEFEWILPVLHTIMHVIGQAWSHSNYFRSPLRLINLFQKLGNQIVRMCHHSLDPQTLFQMELNEAVDKLKVAFRILKEYKVVYCSYRDHMSEYLPSKARPWKFSEERIFGYLNKYLKRLELVEGFFALCLELQKLEKVEIGGVKGESLEKKIVAIFNEFTECLHEFSSITYDAFDLTDDSFVKDYNKFQERVGDWEKRLGAILCRWFDDCDSVHSAFQLLGMFSFMLDHPSVAADFQKCQSQVTDGMHKEIDMVKQMYDEQMLYIKKHGEPLVEDNMPPVAGIIQWSEKLKSRLNSINVGFKQTEQYFKMDESIELYFKKYEGMIKLLEGVEDDLYKAWGQDIKTVVNLSLEQPLITRNLETKLIELNFDPKLAAVLREVQYFKKFEYENIPSRALEVHEQSGTLYDFVIKLSKIGEWYNRMKKTLLPLELAVIRGEISEVDKKLKEAESSMKWKDEGVETYINSLYAIMEDLKTRVFCSKENVERIKRNIEIWSSRPLFERKDGKADALLHLEDRMERVNARNAEVAATGNEILQVLEENAKLLKANKNSKEWKEYVGHMDQIIRTGFFNAIKSSFTYLIENTDFNSVQHPFFEIRMELAGKTIAFVPSINYDESGNIFTIITELTNDIYNMASNISRLDGKKDAGDYVSIMEDMEELSSMYDIIIRRAHKIINNVSELKSSFDQYSYLWEVDKDELLKVFLIYGDIIIDESLEEHELVPNPPTLEHFQKEIDGFEDLWKEVDQMENSTVLGSWLRVDIHLFKQALLNVIRKWSLLFKKYLVDNLTSSLQELEKFLKVSDEGLAQQIEEGDHKTLVSVLGHLKAVKDRQDAIDVMFEPLHQTIELLQNYGEEVPDDVHTQLQELPEQWAKTKKKSYIVKQLLQTHLNTEATNVRHRYADFDVKQIEFREQFLQSQVFLPTCVAPYRVIDKLQLQIVKVENELRSLHDHAALFEVPSPEFRQLAQCRKEIVLIKNLWDYVFLVENMFQHWEKSPWREINVDDMELECKKLIKDVRALDKEMKVWKVFGDLEAKIKNMTISLQAVTKLQDPAIKERHWQQLMVKTKVKFVLDERTTLADLLALNLHMFEDDVREIVDKAIKEQSMEKILSEQKAIWETREFEFELHPRTGNTILKSSEELIEILEDHQVQLQNLATTKHNEHLLPQIIELQKKLGMADQVISLWFDLQHTWSYLESIFVRSEDIRERLPEDSKRFDKVDAEFKSVVELVVKTSNVIAATNIEGLYNKLEELRGVLSICEKALSSYLETKRLLFPRFYFVSASDLLDILSNGNQPELVERHLTKLFDSIAKLEFIPSEDDQPAKSSKGMYSKDGEYVPFSQECDLTGVVERWLTRVLDNMRATVRFQLTDAVASYEDRPREAWVFDYPAQVALVANQIWWTTEVNIAFAKLEEGYENSMRDYNRKQIQQLNVLISMLLEDLTPGNRQKIMTICTIDVHSRDVIAKIVKQKIEKASEFSWQSQLRHRWDEKEADCFANICDAEFQYAHEYLGNSPRLVITPLTDRCYITLTQSLHLYMGGAPAGPAGTGKTETTKDLGRALGCMVYVFNCSEQMDYKSIGNIYKGLAQTGAWGCFDEFNRIAIEVLSVVAVQVKCVQDALKAKKTAFNFLGENITLKPGIGIFITMNPGYAGRTELPENLKAQFRPCAMVVPDFEMICEIMLVAEGFLAARPLARKFITLYSLCKELLSKQDHYDWGLRAIKSVLVVAGSLKRDDRERPENQVLMRALRDFNVPKIISEDIPIFMGLIGDLFPALDVPRKRDAKLEETIKKAAVALKLQPEENFVLKVVQFEELLAVRHSVFVVGNTGTGKSQVCNTLLKTYQLQKRRPVSRDLNPKAVTNDELFGIINPATRDWKDGLFSVTMRDLSNITSSGPKWIILDGDIDPMWIESLNTVMDDNKVLTLASNERIALTPTMRLVFEISSLRTATPATVSRAGILYINPGDLGWNPYVTSWIDERKLPSEKTNLVVFFEKYIPPLLEYSKAHPNKITPIAEISHIQMLCYLLDCFLAEFTTEISKDLYELYFVFATIWAFGACLFQDQLVDYRIEFSKWWIREFKTVKFPSSGTVFDCYVDHESKKMVPWTEKVPVFELEPELPLQSTLVHTVETTRVRYFLDILMSYSRPVMLVGCAGSGKTLLINEKLEQLSDEYLVTNVPFNFYTTSEMLQKVLEKPLEKKAGKNFGPPGIKRMIYFIDDMNMPEVDEYGTVQPHTLIRQHLDYKHWYDRTKLTLKKILNCQYVACMNPTAGSFTINPRLQRHFCVFAVSFPNIECLQTIYNNILSQHLVQPHLRFSQIVQKSAQQIVATCLILHQKVTQTFLPTAVKFHYIFNLRDLSNIFQGLLFSTFESVKTPQELLRLFLHECLRVYRDKLVDDIDMKLFEKILKDIIKKNYMSEDFSSRTLDDLIPIYFHFTCGIGEPTYMPVKNKEKLNDLLNELLDRYNEDNAVMNLVLFEDAIQHICRISRIVEFPRGNALLIGVGGSGKQSLARLAAYISSLETFQITLRKDYGVSELKGDLAVLYQKAGLKRLGIMFLMTNAEIADERFLVLINDLLASGEIPWLFTDDETDNIVDHLRNEVKGLGLMDTKEICWKFFIDKVRSFLKVVLCLSPVGSSLRIRSRKFPALTNCTCIDWFHAWPQQALISVSQRFLKEMEYLPEELVNSVSSFMAYVHFSVKETSKVYLANEFCHNYTTPKTFLELIDLYGNLLTSKMLQLHSNIQRLKNGIEKLQTTADQVETLKVTLVEQEIVTKQKEEDANKLVAGVSEEKKRVEVEQRIAAEEEGIVQAKAIEVGKWQKECQIELAKAEPALLVAQAALNTLDKANLTEMKSFASPPEGVAKVCAAVNILLAYNGVIPKDLSWKASKQMMVKIDVFLDSLQNYRKDEIHKNSIKAVEPLINHRLFKPEIIKNQSFAAHGLCLWVLNMLEYYKVFCEIEPKRIALNAANADLHHAQESLAVIKESLSKFEERLKQLEDEYGAAVDEKVRCEKIAAATMRTIDIAHRLVDGLSSERVRWVEMIAEYEQQEVTLPGDILLISAFVSYIGCFTKPYRIELMDKQWFPFFMKLEVIAKVKSLHSDKFYVLTLMASEECNFSSFGKKIHNGVVTLQILYDLLKDQGLLQDHSALLWSKFTAHITNQEPIPHTKGLNPLTLLTDDVTIAQWNNEGLPGDKMSVENATILTNSERWPLMIDPQLQGIKWIKKKYGNELKIIHLGTKRYLDEVEHALASGYIMLLENIGESLDPILNPLLARNTIKKGTAIILADKEIELHPNFRLILQTKLPNPHYQPEMQAQTTLINFTVTRDGLEDQLLAEVVRQERPDLERMKEELTREQNGFKITLKALEDSVLARLSAATGNLLDDDTLVEELEKTKHTASEIKKKVVEAKKTEEEINKIRELYRDAAARASLLYFVLNDLYKISPLYQFSLKAFTTVFNKAMQKAEQSDNVSKRIEHLIDSITYSTFLYASRGLFEVDKLIFTSQMSLQILLRQKEIDPVQVDFLLRFPSMPNVKSPVDFLTDYNWGAIKVLSDMDEFRNLDKEIEGSAKRWLKFVDSECPEREKFPQEWKNKTALERICMIRCLRPDRMMYAVMAFVEEKLGQKYVSRESIEFAKSFEESSNHTPIFFILSPGVNPLVDVETHGNKLGFTSDNGNFHNISLGQGQEIVAENALELASVNGHWVVLQNIHLVRKWLPRLEKKMEYYAEDSHENFRVFMSAEPSPTRESHIIPQGVLESSIKITNEPPRGMAANLHKALDSFTQDTLEMCSREIEFKAILFSLCYFHAVVAERRKFGPQGWNRIYPFNIGDLTISVHVLHNYLEDSTKVPWEDLRYLFGEIMYGGHITDDWDRRLCRTYLEEYMCPKLLEGELLYAPHFPCPPNLDHKGYHLYITETLPPESPHLYGLHPNAEIGFLTVTSENLFKTLLEMQPRDIGAAEGEYVTREDKIKQILEDIMQKLPDQFCLSELVSRAEDRTPYTVVALQECERMNILTREIKRSLTELELGLKGELTITSNMEELGNSVFLDHVPDSWTSLAYASTLGLAAWFADLLIRARELDTWTSDFTLPSSVWLTGLFNPQSFLTAIMQVTSRKTEQPLDKMCLQCEVTKKNREDFTTSPREGAYIHGLFMEGARWDTSTGFIAEAHLKQLYPQMPVMFIKAIPIEKQEVKNIYECPLYKTRQRGPTYVWTFNLKTKEEPAKWILGGVALLLQI